MCDVGNDRVFRKWLLVALLSLQLFLSSCDWTQVRAKPLVFPKRKWQNWVAQENETIQVAPGDFFSRYRRGLAYVKLGEYGSAMADLTEAMRIDPNSHIAFRLRGTAHVGLEQMDKAIKDFDRAIELAPRFAAAYLCRGDVFRRTGESEPAIRDYNKALAINPELVQIYGVLGDVYRQKEDFESALHYLNRSISADTNPGRSYYWRALTYLSLGDPDSAFDDLTRAVDWAVVAALAPRAYLNLKRGNFHDAISDCNTCEGMGAADADCYETRGRAYAASNKHEAAVRDLTKAIELAPKTGRIYHFRATSLRALGKTADADCDARTAKDLGFSEKPPAPKIK